MSKQENVLRRSANLTEDSSISGAVRHGKCAGTQTRRSFVRGTIAAGIAGIGLSSTAAGASDTADEYGYEDVVNVVDAGADNTGEESITPVLEDARSDNTLFYFPPGEYYMDSQFRFTNFEKFGVFGEDATLVPANYYDFDGPRYRLFRLGTQSRPGKDVRFEGFTVDQTAPDTGIRVIDTYASDNLEVRDVLVRGEHDSGTWGPGHFNVSDPDGTGIVERFRAPDGGAWVHDTPHDGNAWRGPIGIEANQNKGTLTFRRCWTGAFPSHGLYACNGSGKIVVLGGWFRNANGSNIRIGGRDSEIRHPTIEVDSTRDDDQSQRGIRVEKCDNVLVRGPIIRISSPMPTSRAIAVMNSCKKARIEGGSIEMSGDKINHGIVISQDAGEVTIEDTEILHRTAGGYPVWIRGEDRSDRVHLRNVSITGEAGAASGFRDAIRCERNDSRFSYCEVDQTGRDGVDRNGLVTTGNDTTVYRSEIRAERFPYVDQGNANLVLRGDFESHRNDVAAVRLYPDVSNPRLRRSRLINGVDDLGATNLETFRNTFK